MRIVRRLAPYWRHLRLPFQLTLAPIFIWGAMLSGGGAGWGTLAGFVSLHLFLYPAATAFNAVYDRDEGPVGGMAAPPPVPEGLLAFALGLALLGALPAAAAGWAFFLLYWPIAGWTAAYSHPRTRWKAHPAASAAAIGLGQGALGFAAGWAAAAPPDPGAPAFVAGAAVAALTALGLYPATQAFQAEEDRARGDTSLTVALGPAGALRLGAVCLALAAPLAAWLVAPRGGPGAAGAILAGYGGLVVATLLLARRAAKLAPLALYRSAMRLLNAATAGFLIFLAWLVY